MACIAMLWITSGCTLLNPHNVADTGYGIKILDCTNRQCTAEFQFPDCKIGHLILGYPTGTSVPIGVDGRITLLISNRVVFSSDIPAKTINSQVTCWFREGSRLDGYIVTNLPNDILKSCHKYQFQVALNQMPLNGLALYYFWLPWYCRMP